MGRLIACLGLTLLCASASADELRDQSRLHYQLGRESYEKREFATAVKEFKRAYAIVPIPDLLYNIGRSQEQLGDYKNAAANYRLFLAIKLDASERIQLEEHIREIERAIEVKPSPAPSVVAPTTVEPRKKPLYRRWWLWTTIGAVVAVGVGVGVGVGLTQNSGPPALGFPAATVR